MGADINRFFVSLVQEYTLTALLDTPILLITFNRPDHTRRVLTSILAAHPTDLYVFQDGAREENKDDIEKCTEVRNVVEKMTSATQVRLHTKYVDTNLGCGAGPMTGLD